MLITPPPALTVPEPDDRLSPRLLTDHHTVIEQACRAILAATYADLSLELVTAFRAFEAEVLEHMLAEEDELLPAFAEAATEEAALVRGEHARLRYLLEMVGVDVELHTLRAEKMHALIAALTSHASREDERMYPWAARHLDTAPAQRLTERVRGSIARLRGIAHPTAAR